MEHDNVNHPQHYTDGSIEVLDFIEDKKLNYHRGNSVKYICRAGKNRKKRKLKICKKRYSILIGKLKIYCVVGVVNDN